MASEPLDLSGYSTAAGAAKALHKYLTEELGAGDACKLYRPEENPRQNGAWGVSWEGGPYEWAVWLTGGESLYAGAGSTISYGTDPEVVGIGNSDYHAEPYHSFDLQFYNQ